MDEQRNWAINIEEVRQALARGREQCEPRVMVVINPGNPTGQFILYPDRNFHKEFW